MYKKSQKILGQLQEVHTANRLSSYLAVTGSLGDAFELYVWNTALASRFYGSLQAVEVGLRNACHRELEAFLGPTWFNSAAFISLDPEFRGTVRAARRNGATPDDVVTNLPLSFWKKIFDPALDPWLWDRVLARVFTAAAPRSQLAIVAELEQFRVLRNRIAHLRPLHSRAVERDLERLERLAGWIHPTLETWMREYDAVSTVFFDKPEPRHGAANVDERPLQNF